MTRQEFEAAYNSAPASERGKLLAMYNQQMRGIEDRKMADVASGRGRSAAELTQMNQAASRAKMNDSERARRDADAAKSQQGRADYLKKSMGYDGDGSLEDMMKWYSQKYINPDQKKWMNTGTNDLPIPDCAKDYLNKQGRGNDWTSQGLRDIMMTHKAGGEQYQMSPEQRAFANQFNAALGNKLGGGTQSNPLLSVFKQGGGGYNPGIGSAYNNKQYKGDAEDWFSRFGLDWLKNPAKSYGLMG